MRYQLKQIFCRPWTLNGFSLPLIESHYENNYGGAVRRLNAIAEQLDKLDFAKTPGYVINGLKREELAALNSSLLHELYFSCLGGEGRPTKGMSEALERDFGSYLRWRDQFSAMGYALGGGSGWVVLTWLPRDQKLVNQYASEHSQSVAGGVPILALDMYEHAYHLDFGANAAAYVDAFLRNIDWQAVDGRHADALDAGKPLQLIDARPRHFVSRTQDIVVGATWRDPERVQEWIGELSKSEPVVVYCAYGFHVGCKTTIALREAGFDAKYLKGGHSGLRAIGSTVKLNT